MKLDLTVTITAILGIAAIISPIATALINNRHQLKLKKLEYQQKEKESSYFYKRGIYEDYLKYTSECITYATQDALQKYGEIYGLALIYFPEDLIEDMEELNRIMRNSSPEERMSLFNKLAPKIRAILQNM
ncbi:hypothetical protein [Eubacterium ramulus]|jgi:hypothetical protein|uniref:hypothetical protein n=1 Tax=Eubacterium ramulus TaxID=39490 RepID=UPI0022E5A7ED|nr:hypothetical protein [Eubacterium ramulus]